MTARHVVFDFWLCHVFVWLITGPCCNGKADGHWQTQKINLRQRGTDRSGTRSPVIFHEMILDCRQPRLTAPLPLNSCNSCNLVDSILPCVRSVIDDSRETSKRGKKKSNRHVSRRYSWAKKGVVPGKNLA